MDLYSLWISLDTKLAVSGSMNLVADMATDAKREIRLNTLGFTYIFLFIYRTILLCLNTEIRRFAYNAIRQEDCEDTSRSSPPGESRVSAYRLTSIGY